MAANTDLLLKKVEDITECPICTEVFCNPKTLPCFHTFCLKCIEQYGEDSKNGEALPCPMCRREFKVPTGGLSKLPTNFFIERLISAQYVSCANREADCDVCTEAGRNGKMTAVSFCMTCRENLCYECCKIHKSMKITKGHKLSPVGEVSEVLRKKLEASFCIKHPTKELEFYCRVCKVPSCATCSITNHKSHEICEIGDTAETFKKDLWKLVDDVSAFKVTIKERSEWASEEVETFTGSIEKVKKDIMKRSEQIKQMVDRQTTDLLRELNIHKISILKNIESDEEGLRRNMMICDSFKQFCTNVIMEADSVEVVRVADEVKTRAEEVKGLSLPEPITLPRIKFVPFDLDTNTNKNNIVGNIYPERIFSLKAIGQGGYSVVYQSVYFGEEEFRKLIPGRIVAYKKLKVEFIEDKDVDIFREEADLHLKLEHKNIIKCLGTIFEPGNYGIIFEFAEYGELRDYLIKNTDLRIKLSMLHDVALGMEYLHGIKPNPVIHGDLKIQNILVGQDKVAKICDFGFSHVKDYSQSRSMNEVRLGTVTHIPPEFWIDNMLRKTEKFDVYSFGICAWEIITLEKPFENARSNSGIIRNWVLSGRRPPLNIFPSGVPERIRDVIQDCWAMAARARPSFSHIRMQCHTAQHKPTVFEEKINTKNV